MIRARLVLAIGAIAAVGCGDDGTGLQPATTGSSTGGGDGTTAAVATSQAGDTTSAPTSTATGDLDTTAAGSSDSTGDPCACAPLQCPPECTAPLEPEIGFAEIEPVTFTLHHGAQSQTLTSSPARLWYGFAPAAQAPEDAPLLVLFNGGPGAASEVIFAFNTTDKSFDEAHNGGGAIGDSPSSFTAFANVLYIDARITGFSYNLMDDPTDPVARAAELGIQNFNTWLDAADFVRVVLRFLAAHPQIFDSEVVLVGESYGGVRATAMLDLLLRYGEHASAAATYEDAALAQEIQAHFDALLPAQAGRSFGPDVIAQQFSKQVLVQPLVLGDQQHQRTGQLHDAAGSVIFQIATDTGTNFVPCSAQGLGCDPFFNALDFVELVAGRDRFTHTMPYGWLFERIDSLSPKLSTLSLATEMFGADPVRVPDLHAKARTGAWRTPGMFPAPPSPPAALARGPRSYELMSPGFSLVGGGFTHADGDYPATFGALEPWDTYYLASNYIVLDAFYSGAATGWGVDPYADELAIAFLHDVLWVDTFITNAAWDLVIWSPAIPDTMEQFPTYVQSAVHDELGPAGVERPGQILVDYPAGAFGRPTAQQRTIRFPIYDASGHTVPLHQPQELADDIAAWL